MKAMVIREFGGPEVLNLEDVPQPLPEAGELVLTAISAGDKPGEKEAKVGIGPAGPIRINIGTVQYQVVQKKR